VPSEVFKDVVVGRFAGTRFKCSIAVQVITSSVKQSTKHINSYTVANSYGIPALAGVRAGTG
jgi:hypothetical protein